MSVENRHRLPNKVSEFVLENVSRWEDLNAPTLEGGGERYKNALISTLKKQKVLPEVVGTGGYLVQPMAGYEDLVIKRLLTWPDKDATGEWFDERREEHAMFQEYFGDFIPPTDFAIVPGTHFGDSAEEFSQPDEYVSIQERVSGFQVNDPKADLNQLGEIAQDRMTPAMRDRIELFIGRYQKMADEQHCVPDDQIIFDFERETVWIVDTNDPRRLQSMLSENRIIERNISENDEVTTSRQVVDVITKNIPEFNDLIGKPWVEIKDEFRRDSSRVMLTSNAISNREHFHTYLDFESLISAIEQFPPEGENVFIRDLRSQGIAHPEKTEEQVFVRPEPKVGSQVNSMRGELEEGDPVLRLVNKKGKTK